MSDPVTDLVKAHLKQLRLPAMARELERLSREAAGSSQNYEQFLLRLAEEELAARSSNALETRIKNAAFPVAKDFDTYDFTAMPTLSKPKILELATCEWIDQKFNCCFIGNTGTGKTHLATGLGLAACRRGLRVRFFTAAALVSKLEQVQKQYTLDKFLGQLDRADLLICDEPVSSLDVSTQSQVINLLMDLQRERNLSLLFIAHDLSVVRHISNRIAVMYLGRIVEVGDARQVYVAPKHPYTQALLSAIPIPEPNEQRSRERIVLGGDVPSPLNVPSGCRFRTRCPYAMDVCWGEDPPPFVASDGATVYCHLHTSGPTLAGASVAGLEPVPQG